MELSKHGIVALVRDQSGKFLLLEDSRELMKGHWAPPHGRCKESDQNEEECVIREVREETGLIVRPVKKILTQSADTKVKTVSFWTVQGPNGTPVLNGESSSFGWFSVRDALGLKLYPGTRSFFESVQSGMIKLPLIT